MEKYSLLMRINHWVMALLIVTLIAVGMWMTSLPNDYPGKYDVYALHKSFGVIALLFIMFRLAVRLRSGIPAMPRQISSFEQLLGKSGHTLFYILIFIQPISGYLFSNYAGYPIVFFGEQLPTIVEKHEDYAKFFVAVHKYVAWGLIILISLHIVAPIKHLLVDRVNIFKRIW